MEMKFLYIIGAFFILLMIFSAAAAVLKNNNYFMIIFIISALMTYYDLSNIMDIKRQELEFRHLEAMKDLDIKQTKEIYDMIYSKLAIQKNAERGIDKYEEK